MTGISTFVPGPGTIAGPQLVFFNEQPNKQK